MAAAGRPETWTTKYGAMANGRFGIDKSGFSPTEYTLPILGQSTDPDIDKIETFQRNQLYGFTSRELGQLGCLPTRELTPGNLQNGIIPMLRRENWERAPAQPDFTRDHLYPLKNGNGMWSADNDAVWDVMEPIIILASRMLLSVHVMPWFDALLNGERKTIQDDRLHPDDKNMPDLQSFHARPSFTQAALAKQMYSAFETLLTAFRLKYGFMITSESPEGPEHEPEDSLGFTISNREYMMYDPEPNKSWRICVFINLSQPEMLMRDGLNSAERMTIQWSIANTIVHETMHALFISLNNNAVVAMPDPYFEDDAVAEVGFSFESTINSGVPEPFLYNSTVTDPPLGYWLGVHWPTYADLFARDPETAILTAPGPTDFQEYFPIPISFYQDIQQEEFWSVLVRQFGNKIFHYRALKEGAGVGYIITDAAEGEYCNQKPIRFTEKNPIDMLNGKFRSSVEALKSALNMTPDERKALHFGQAFVLSSELEEQFWTDAQHQMISIQPITNAVTDATQNLNTPDHVRHVYLTILNCTQQAITNHEQMIAGIISLEQTNGVTYTDRRANLLTWNRGTRVFIQKVVQADAQGNLNVNVEQLRMENCRMALWNPKDLTTQKGNEYLEIQILQHARQALNTGDHDECRDLCTRLLQEDWRSIFGQCMAGTILFALDKDVRIGWTERLANLQKVLSVVGSMKAAAPEYWRDELEALETEVTALSALQPPSALIAI